MGWGTPDVYGQPEHFGLTIVGSLDDPEACYSFDMLLVLQHKDGSLFYATDSGCSCPSPFEYVTSMEDLEEPISSDNWDAFVKDVQEHCSWVKNNQEFEAEKGELLATVAKLLWEQEKKNGTTQA